MVGVVSKGYLIISGFTREPERAKIFRPSTLLVIELKPRGLGGFPQFAFKYIEAQFFPSFACQLLLNLGKTSFKLPP